MNKIKCLWKNIKVSTIYKILVAILLVGILIGVYLNLKILKMNEKIINNNVISTSTLTNTEENAISPKVEYLLENTNKEDYSMEFDNNTNVYEIESQSSPNTTEDSKVISKTILSNASIENVQYINPDEEVVAFMNETEEYFSDTNIKEDVKERFIIIVDFLFYNGEIKGYTLDDLSSKAKLQVLKVALSIDSKIDKYFLGYKESISKTTGKIYTGIKNKIIEIYLETTTKICNYDSELCISAKKDFQEMKKVFSITWNAIKDLISRGTKNLKAWYEIYSGKVS